MIEPVDIENLKAHAARVERAGNWGLAKSAFEHALSEAFPAIIAELEAGREAARQRDKHMATTERINTEAGIDLLKMMRSRDDANAALKAAQERIAVLEEVVRPHACACINQCTYEGVPMKMCGHYRAARALQGKG